VGAAEALGGSLDDCPEDAVRILIQVIVPDAQDGPASLREERIASLIPLGFGMLCAVQLDDQLRLPAREIGKIRSNRELSRELRSKPRDHAPKLALMRRRAIAEFPCSLSLI